MEYFLITKTSDKCELDKKINTKSGFKFNHKLKITLYNTSMIKYILTKKINTNIKNIIDLLLYAESQDDEDGKYAVTIKIDTLRRALLEKYSVYIGLKETKNYLIKLDKIDKRAKEEKIKKSMRR